MTVKIDGSNGLLANYDYQTPLTGFTYTFTTFNVLFAVPAGTLATGTVTMSATPVDGTVVTITTTQQITALTINANTGQSIIGGGAVQLNANTSRQYMYRAANTTWYLINVAAGAVVTSFNGATGAVTAPAGLSGQVFTTTGANTFTVPAGVTAVKVTVIGGGGGGGSGQMTVGGGSIGGGGGAGGTAIEYITGLTPGGTVTATVGTGGGSGTAGGTSSFGAFCSATGGAAGQSTVNNVNPTGGAGGSGTGGNINLTGGSGTGTVSYSGASGIGGGTRQAVQSFAFYQTSAPCYAVAYGQGWGGAGEYGAGANGVTGNSAGGNATGYGNGGSGAYKSGSIGTLSGGSGSQGIIIVEW